MRFSSVYAALSQNLLSFSKRSQQYLGWLSVAGLSLGFALSAVQVSAAQGVTLVPTIITYAGTGSLTTTTGGNGGLATAAGLNNPEGIAYDARGNTYIADYNNNVIRIVNSAGVINAFAGTGTACANPTAATGACGDGGAASAATFNNPSAMQFDAQGNLYIADLADQKIRKIAATNGVVSSSSTITTVAGTGAVGNTGAGGLASAATLYYPHGLALDTEGNLWIANQGLGQSCTIGYVPVANQTITIGTTSTALTAGHYYVVAGVVGSCGYNTNSGQGTSVDLNSPTNIALDGAGNLYIGDYGNGRVRKLVTSSGALTTIAGTGYQACPVTGPTTGVAPAAPPTCGDGGQGTVAALYGPTGVYVDASNNIIIGDAFGARVREVSGSTGIITTIAGTSQQCTNQNQSSTFSDGTGNVLNFPNCGDGTAATKALVSFPILISVNPAGNILYVDQYDNKIREIIERNVFPATNVGSTSASQNINLATTGTANTIITSISVQSDPAGNPEFTVGTVTGCVVGGTTGNAPGSDCTIPVTFNPAYTGTRSAPLVVVTNGGTFQFGLTGTGVAPLAVLSPGILSTVAGTGTAGTTGNGGQATAATFNTPRDLTFDNSGNYYIGDLVSNEVRKVTAAGAISVFAGGGTTNYVTNPGGAATAAALSFPTQGVFDAVGNMYIADFNHHVVARVDAVTNAITVYAGNGTAGYMGDGGLATAAELSGPASLAIDPTTGNLYIADAGTGATGGGQTVRMVNASSGIISTVAGNGSACASSTATCGDGGQGTAAQLNQPNGLTVDANGNLYISDTLDNRIRMINKASGIITTVAGTGTAAYSGDGAAATSAALNTPFQIQLDAAGDLYIADKGNNAIRFVSAATGNISTIAGNGTVCTTVPSPACGDGGPANVSAFSGPNGVALDVNGNIYVAEAGTNRVRKITNNPTSLAFPTTPVGTAVGPLTANLYNIGNATLTYTPPASGSNAAVTSTGPTGGGASSAFAQTNSTTCGPIYSNTATTTLASGANCLYSVSFTPDTIPGNYTGTLIETDNSLYSGSGNSIYPTALTQTINLTGAGTQATASVALTSSVNPTTYGQSTTFTVTLSGAAGTPTATNGIPLTYTPTGSTTPVSLGAANATSTAGVYTLTTSALPVGTDNVVATYGGNTDYAAGSTSNTVAQVVNKAVGSGDTVTANPTATPFGSPVTLTFTVPTVAGATASPTGTVTFTNGTTTLGTATLTTTGTGANAVTTATLTTSTLPVGTDTVTATYPGDANYAAANPSPTATETVTQVTPTASLTASPATGDTYGAPVVLTETITAINGVCPTSTVSFASGSATLGTATFPATPTGNPATCVATITTTALPVGNDTIMASAPAGGSYAAISSTTTETVAMASGANDKLTANPTSSTFGSSVALTFTVPTVAGASASPTGTVTFTSGGVTLGTGTLATTGTGANAVTTAILTTSQLPVGTDTVTAAYPGDANYAAANPSPTAIETVTQATPTASLAASPATGDTYGSPVVLTETVVAINGSCPTSTVTFASGGVTLGTGTFTGTPAANPTSCTATTTTTALPVGTDTVTATAPAASNFGAISSSTTESVAVAPGTGDTLTANPTSSTFGSSVVLTFTVPTVAGATASPTGTVTFTSGGVTLGTATLTTTGTGANAVTTATLTTSSLPVGTDTVTAAYPGNANYGSGSASATETVSPATPTASLAASPATGDTYGSPVVLTETVSAINGACPTSIVTFASGGVTLGTGTFTGAPSANPTSCTATLTTTALPVGTDTVTATAPAGGNFGTISSSTTETVATAPGTSDTLMANPTSSTFGSSVALTFTVPTVAGASAPPTGTITFTSGGVTLGTATLATTGTGANAVTTATLNSSALPVGTDTVTASYPGNANYSSGSATATETVGQATPVASLTASPATGDTYGAPVVLTETVTPINGACPTSTVTFASGGVTLGTATFPATPTGNPASCTATVTTTALPVGTDTVTAMAPASGSFGAISSSISETVGVASGANDTLTANPTSTAYGSPVTLTFTVPTVAGASAPPAGTVTFSNGSTTLGTATLTTTGTGANAVTTATLTTSTLPVGTDTVTATYPGNANYAAANPAPTATVTVGQVTPTASLTASPATGATYGSSVTLTETVAAINGACPTSTVTFASGGTTLGTANFPATPTGNPASCTATITTTALPVGTDTITATAPAAGSFGAISSSTTETIATASGASDTLTANPSTSTFGSPVQLVFTVPTVAGASSPPTGTVTFTSGGVTLGTAMLTTVGSGANATTTATLNTSSLPVGTDTVTATYPGNANYAAASPAPTAVETVNPASVTGVLAATPATGDTFGSPVTLTETISPINGVCPTATVTFASNGTTLGTGTFTGTPAANPISCVAMITTTSLPVGTDPITATAPASGSFAAISSSTTESVAVASGANDTLTANPTSAAYGSPVTLTFTVPTIAGASASPTGTVTFTSGGVTLGTGTLTTTGTGASAVTTATLTTSALPVGTDTVTATYPGNANYGAATPAPTATVTITQGAANGTLTASPATGDTYGAVVTLTESVTPINGACPTAVVTFTSNGSTLGTATFPATPTGTPASCIASITTTALPVGTDPITATAPAAGSFGPISSSTTETVGVAPGSGDTLTANPTTSIFGSPVTLTFTIPAVTGASAPPTGTVTFTSGGITLGTGTLSTTNGVTTATLITSTLSVGTDTITASYPGNANYGTGSATATETVTPITSNGTLTASPATGDTYGMTVTLTETIAPVNGVCPTATVTFASGVTTLGTGTFVSTPAGSPTSCIATTTTTALPVGTDPITATAPAAGSFGPISSATTEIVGVAPGSGDTLAANPTTSIFGTPVTLTFTIPTVAGASAPPTGTVTFTSGGTTLGTGTLSTTNGVTTATLTTSVLPVGTDTVTATYPGNANYGAGSATATETVTPVTPTGTLTASPSTGDMYGMTVTLSETIAPVNGACPVAPVTFANGGTTLGTANFAGVPAINPTSCVATTTTTALPVGTDTITATAPAAGSFGPISSSTTETVAAASGASDTLTANPTTSAFGSPVVLTFTVPTIAGAPAPASGTVTFTNGTTTLGTGTLSTTNGVTTATLTTSTLPVGTDTVTASYAGNGSYGASSPTATVTVTPAVTNVTLTASPATGDTFGVTVTLTESIAPINGVCPISTVTFTSGGVTLGTGTFTPVPAMGTPTSCVATTTTTALPVGTDNITATAPAAGSFGPISSSTTETVGPAPATGVLTAQAPSGSTYGSPVTLTETVAPINGVCPTGVVTFSDGGVTLGSGSFAPVPATGTPTSCVASLVTTALPSGTSTVTATYPGNGTFGPITSTTSVTIAPASANGDTLTATPTSSVVGTPVKLTFTIPAVSGVAGLPSGTVTFSSGGVTLGTGTITTVNGVSSASITTTALPVGADTVTATYTGNANYGAATLTTVVNVIPNDFAIAATPPTQTVNPGDSAIYTVSLSGLVVPFNSPVTLTATGLPPGATVTFANPTYVPGAGPTSTTMTIVTSPTQAMLKQTNKGNNGIYYGLLLLPLLGLGSVRRKIRSIPNGISYCLAALLLLGGMGVMTGCGGGYFGPAPKTYTITVTGTSVLPSGTLAHSTTVTLEVR